jgi:hypothetical protein
MTMDTIPFEGPQYAAEPRQIRRGVKPAAWKAAIYGGSGLGKTTLAAKAPRAFVLDLERGTDRVECDSTPEQLTTLTEVFGWLKWFKEEQSEFQTVVIDTIDELDKMLSSLVVARYGKSDVKTVADIPYGRGGDMLVAEWRLLIEALDRIVASGKNVLFTGHEQIIKFENPSDANFDFVTINTHKKVAPVLVAKLDAVLHASLETHVIDKNDKGKGKATGSGRRILRTTQLPSVIAKNRFNLPDVLPLDAVLFDKMK